MLHRNTAVLIGRNGMRGGWRSMTTISFQKSMNSVCEHRSPQLNVVEAMSPACHGDSLVIPFHKLQNSIKNHEIDAAHLKHSIPEGMDRSIRNLIEECLDDGSFTADAKENYVLRVPKSTACTYKHLVLAGMGAEDDDKLYKELGKRLCSIAKDLKSPKIDFLLRSEVEIHNVLLGLQVASYDDTRYKGDSEIKNTKDVTGLKNLTFIGVAADRLSTVSDLLQLHSLTSAGVSMAKDLVNAPPNSKTPLAIADFARDIAALSDSMECNVLGLEECVARNMGGFLAVQQGSKFPPQFIHMKYKSKNSSKNCKKIALIGKGLTFDSGGYNLKAGPGSMIEMMKFDMGGLGAVLGTASVVAALDALPPGKRGTGILDEIEVHFISAVCENMISRDAMRPGDVVTASNGKTIEILNTDAEGRLTLADALVYAETVVEADVIIDLATLTGASMVALGENIGSLFASGKMVKEELLRAAQRSGDNLWPMPLHEAYRPNIKSKLADIKNIGDGKAGSITAALFLQEFVRKDREWAHIDMAGPVWDNAAHKPTGYGVSLLVEYLVQQALEQQHGNGRST